MSLVNHPLSDATEVETVRDTGEKSHLSPGAPAETLGTFLVHVPVNAWIKDGQGRYLFLNPRAHQSVNPQGRPILGMTDFDLLDRRLAERLREHDQNVLATGKAMQLVEEGPGLNGESRRWYTIKFALHLGGARYVAGVAVDITDHSSPVTEKKGVQHKLYQILDAISDLVMVKGEGSRLEWANKAFRDMYGMTNEQLQGLIDAPFTPPDLTQKYLRDDQKVWSTGQPLDIPEELVTRHDGKSILVHTKKSAIVDQTGRVVNVVGVARDISDRKALELELRQAQKLESVGRLAAGIAHEINSPIQFIGDHNTFIRDAFGDLRSLLDTYREVLSRTTLGAEDATRVRDAEVSADLEYLQTSLPRAFEVIGDGVSRVAKLVNAMKEFGHPDRGEREEADINRALGNTLTIVMNELRHVADVRTAFEELPLVECQISDLNQVFLNLLVNAAHAIADARPEGRGTITVTTRHDNEAVVVSIADDGTGIPAEHHEKVFEPFFTTKEVGRGTGQGLAISRMVVEKHHGTLTFQTRVGHGTTFHVRIPVRAQSTGRAQE